jgi:hypothetical protein
MNLVFSFLGFYVPNIEEDEMLEIKLNNLFFYIDATDRMFKSANDRNN